MSVWGWILCGYVLVATIPLVIVDFRAHRLPNVIVVPGIGLALACIGGAWLTSGEFPLVPSLSGLAYACGMLLLAVLGGMGMGDVKLALVLGTASGMLGASAAIANVFLAFVLGGVAAVVVLLWQRIRHRRRTRTGQHHTRTHIAFGPFMLAGFWVSTLVVVLR